MNFIKYLLLLVMVVTLSSCKQENNEIPLIIYNGQDPYIENFEKQIKKEGSFWQTN